MKSFQFQIWFVSGRTRQAAKGFLLVSFISSRENEKYPLGVHNEKWTDAFLLDVELSFCEIVIYYFYPMAFLQTIYTDEMLKPSDNKDQSDKQQRMLKALSPSCIFFRVHLNVFWQQY